MANFLLLRAYTVGAKHFVNNAVSDLCDETWRFQCGYSGSDYWIAIQLIKTITPLCSVEDCVKIEKAIMNYIPPWERTSGGCKYRGQACFNLLSAIPVELMSKKAQDHYTELEQKFVDIDSPLQEGKAYIGGPPVDETVEEKMTDEQWLEAIKKYNSNDGIPLPENPETGGILELACMLHKFVKQEPERFARLSLRFPSDTHPLYIEYTLYGLKETESATELKLEVCHKAYNEYRDSCGKAISVLLGSIEDPLPDDAVQMLNWLATEHTDPERELWNEVSTNGSFYYGGDILTHGSSTTRGQSALAIGDLIQRNSSYIERFHTTIERLVDDNSVAVRACTSSILSAAIDHDPKFALERFIRLVKPRNNQHSDDRLLVTTDVERFIYDGLYDYFEDLRSIVKRMLRSDFPETSDSGARLASIVLLDSIDRDRPYSIDISGSNRLVRHFFTCTRGVLGILKRLFKHDAESLVEEAIRGNPSQRLGVAKVASDSVGKEAYRLWSEKKLLLLFDDDDSEVRQEAARCFRSLEGSSLESYENLISKFCDSAAYQEDSFSLLYVLEESPYKLPGITYIVCNKFLERFGEVANNISASQAGDVSMVSKLILRTYHQHQHDKWAAKCLDLIDRMYLERIYDIRKDLDEHER